MPKKNENIKSKIDLLLKSVVIIFIILFNSTNIVYGVNINWDKISETPEGIQYIDRENINNKGKGIIELSTKYLRIDTNDSKRIEENIYTMRINCLTNKFKDISVNGKKNLTAKWEDTNEDKLLDDVILNSCKNV